MYIYIIYKGIKKVIFFKFFSKERQTATCSASFGCAWSLGARLPYVSPTNGPWACLEVLAGECSYFYTNRCSSAGELVLINRARGFGRDTHGAVREEGDTRLASQISRINTSDQWGDRCRSQIALTSEYMRARAEYIYGRHGLCFSSTATS